jgi:hypothetical protein
MVSTSASPSNSQQQKKTVHAKVAVKPSKTLREAKLTAGWATPDDEEEATSSKKSSKEATPETQCINLSWVR